MVATATAKRSTKPAAKSSSMMTETKIKSTRVDPVHVDSSDAAFASIPTASIFVTENDRQVFDVEAIERLAESIRLNGLLQPLVVTPDGDGFRLVAGERRLRAIKLLKLKSVTCKVQKGLDSSGGITEAETRFQRFTENAERENLNPIEIAMAYSGLLKYGTPKAVAARLKVSQGQFSNTVRLLELPEIWQQWVAAGKLAKTAVRVLLPFAAKRPQVLQWLVDKFATQIDDGGFEFNDYIVSSAVQACTRSMDQSSFYEWSKPEARSCWFDRKKLSASVKEELDVESIDDEDRAWNVSLWNECNAEDFDRVKLRYKKAAAKRSTFTTERTKGDSESKIDRLKLNNATIDVLATILRSKLDLKQHGPMLPALMCVLNYQDLGYNVACAISKARLHGVSHDPAALAEHLATVSVKEQTKIVFDAIKSELSADADYCIDISELLPIATLLKIDLRSFYRPNRQTLELFPEKLLRTYGMKLCGIKQAEQPDTLEGVLDWLEEDWPEGQLPVEVAKLLK